MQNSPREPLASCWTLPNSRKKTSRGQFWKSKQIANPVWIRFRSVLIRFDPFSIRFDPFSIRFRSVLVLHRDFSVVQKTSRGPLGNLSDFSGTCRNKLTWVCADLPSLWRPFFQSILMLCGSVLQVLADCSGLQNKDPTPIRLQFSHL